MNHSRAGTMWRARMASLACIAVCVGFAWAPAFAQTYVPGGTLVPTAIPKYVVPLVIPPQMPKTAPASAGTPAADYNIAVRQFKQQILPGGVWDALSGRTDALPPTTVWSYGRAEDPVPDITGLFPTLTPGVAPAPNSTFNYPAFTVENTTAVATQVRWINDLVNPTTGGYLPHLFPVDQTLHWANPPNANCTAGAPNRTDCETAVAATYTGPVPMVTHVHGAHVQGHSDGYPEAWWLPNANDIPAGYALKGSRYGQANTTNSVAGTAFFSYENTQPASTIWYHDHALGMTRVNVYAGPAGFWLIRGGANDTAAGVLPGPAPTLAGGDPNFDAVARAKIREIPLAIQDRSFNSDGSLFYPQGRSFFDNLTGPFIGNAGFTGPFAAGPPPTGPSDMSGIWNPEAFFNTMVVNGTTWPKFEVAPARYRFRILNGTNSRTLNLSMFIVTGAGADTIMGTADDVLGAEVPFYLIGSDQGFLPQVVKITKGFTTTLPGNGTTPAAVAAPSTEQALLMGSAERADVIIDFGGMTNSTRVRIFNTAPDSPFQGFPANLALYAPADPGTTGQVMDFIVNTTLPAQPTDTTSTPPVNLVLPAPPALGTATVTRQVSLNEMVSDQVCVEINGLTGAVVQTLFSTTAGDLNFLTNCAATPVAIGNTAGPAGPRMAQLGTLTTSGVNLVAVPLLWRDAITERPLLNDTETWEIYNTTADAHPIHLHLVGFEVVNRQDLDPAALLLGNLVPIGVPAAPQPHELGFKDTVLSYPGKVTRLKAKFDIAGRYVWHCHIIEHEDNEMMRPYEVNADLLYSAEAGVGIRKWDGSAWSLATPNAPVKMAAAGSLLYGDFGSGHGIWKWDGTVWSQLTPAIPETMASTGSVFYGDFGSGHGIWKWDGTVWSQLTPESPEMMTTAGTDLYGTFTGFGIWKWNGASWSQLTQEMPAAMAASGANLYGAFMGFGIWKWDGVSWTQLTPETPQVMAASSTKVYCSFTGFGIYQWDGASWTQISPNIPESLMVSDTLLYGDFGANGISKWDGTAWTQITATNPMSMATGF